MRRARPATRRAGTLTFNIPAESVASPLPATARHERKRRCLGHRAVYETVVFHCEHGLEYTAQRAQLPGAPLQVLSIRSDVACGYIRLSREPDTQREVRRRFDSRPDDDAGHGVGLANGGCNCDSNYVAQCQATNNGGAWKRLETAVRQCLNPGRKYSLAREVEERVGSVRGVHWFVRYTYPDAFARRPSTIAACARFVGDDGRQATLEVFVSNEADHTHDTLNWQ
jgi:hypothetical protein